MEKGRTGLGLIETMDVKSYCLNLLDFHQWRQKKIDALLRKVNSDILSQHLSGSFNSLLVMLNHLVWAEKLWLGRVNRNEVASMKDLNAEGLMDEWENNTTKWRNLLENTPAEDFSAKHSYHNTEGGKYENTLFEIVVHLIDHSTYHIGQMMNGMRALGLEPVPTNYIHYLRDINQN